MSASSSKKSVAKEMAEKEKGSVKTTSASSSTGATLGSKKTETKMKIPKKVRPTGLAIDDDADEDYVTFLNSMTWKDYE